MRALAQAFLLTVTLALPATAQWHIQNSSPAVSLRGLSVINARVVWASGTAGTYLRTTDGGANWNAAIVPDAGSLDFRGVVAFDSDTALLMSSGPAEQGQARIFKTRDAGKTWTQVYHGETKGMFLDAIAFWDRQHGIALSDPVGGKFALITTADGGDTWKPILAEGMPPALPKEGAFAASNSCLVVGGASEAWFATGGGGVARVFHSHDGGRTWTVIPTPVNADTASSGIFSLAFRDARTGIAAGGDYQKATAGAKVAITADGGRKWKPAEAPIYFSGVAFVPGTTGKDVIAVGSAGWAQSSDGGRNWTAHTDRGFNAISFSPDGAGWAVGAQGVIAIYKPLTLKK